MVGELAEPRCGTCRAFFGIFAPGPVLENEKNNKSIFNVIIPPPSRAGDWDYYKHYKSCGVNIGMTLSHF